jgi:putative transposase
VNKKLFNADCVGAYNIMKKYLRRSGLSAKQADRMPDTAVVGLDTPIMYKWNACDGFIWNQKLAFSKAM